MSGNKRQEGPPDQGTSPAPPFPDAHQGPPEVTPFTRSAIRMVMPRELPPTPRAGDTLSGRLRRLWKRLRPWR